MIWKDYCKHILSFLQGPSHILRDCNTPFLGEAVLPGLYHFKRYSFSKTLMIHWCFVYLFALELYYTSLTLSSVNGMRDILDIIIFPTLLLWMAYIKFCFEVLFDELFLCYILNGRFVWHALYFYMHITLYIVCIISTPPFYIGIEIYNLYDRFL